MGSFGYIAGGLMQGLGEGIAKSGMLAAQQRHETLMENLRAQRQRENNQQQADLQDRNDENASKRRLTANLETNKQEHGFRVTEKKLDTQAAERLTRIRADLDQRNDAASIRLRDELDSGKVKDILPTTDGYVKVYANGRTEPTDYQPVPRASAGDGLSDLLDEERPAPATPAPAPAKAPSTYTKAEYDAGLSRYAMSQNRSGKSADQIKKDWDALLRSKGLKLGAN